MTETVAHDQMRRYECPDECPWMDAFMLLRTIVTDPRNAAAPAKCLGGAVTVVETVLARQLGITLSSLQQLIRDDYERHHGPKGAQDGAEFEHPHL